MEKVRLTRTSACPPPKVVENICICWSGFCGDWLKGTAKLDTLLCLLLVLLALAHNGGTKSPTKVVGELVQLGVAIDLNGLFGGVAHHIAVVAPSQVVFQF